MANLRANKIVGIGSTDAGVTFDGLISLNSQGYMYFPTGNTEIEEEVVQCLVVVRNPSITGLLIMFTYLQVEML